MTAHGVFGKYLQRIGKRNGDACWYCGDSDTVEHTLFNCPKWEVARNRAERKCGNPISSENISELILGSEEKWNIIMDWIRQVMRTKEQDK